MDYSLKNRYVYTASEILDTSTQQQVDLDFTLPDYCADIEKILKCSLVPKIYTRTFSAGQLRVDGASIVRILYCDSHKKFLRCCEQTVPFSATIPVSTEPSESIVITTAKPEYLNCRVLTPRRLTIHGSFSLNTSVVARNVFDIKHSCDNNMLQVKTETQEICELCEFNQEMFSVAESVNIRTNNNIETIVRSDVSALITDFAQNGEKLQIKGEATLRMLYVCDAATGDIDQFVYVFPFTQSIDAKEKNCDITDVKLDVLSYEILLRGGLLTDEPGVSLDIKMSATVTGYKKTEVTYITDAYSVADETELEYENLTVFSDVMPVNSRFAVKSNLSLGDVPIKKIHDIFWEDPNVTGQTEDKELVVSGKVRVCILGATAEGELVCIERQADIRYTSALSDSFSLCKCAKVCVTSVSFRMTENNSLEIRLDMQLSAMLYNLSDIRQVSNVTNCGEKSVSKKHPLTLYYAQKGELVWDIAKRYSTSLESVCTENSLDCAELENSCMLMILNV